MNGCDVRNLNAETLKEYTLFANAAATLCVAKRGAIPAMPDLNSVEELLKKES